MVGTERQTTGGYENPVSSIGEPLYRINDQFDIAGYDQRKQKMKTGKPVKTKKSKSKKKAKRK